MGSNRFAEHDVVVLIFQTSSESGRKRAAPATTDLLAHNV